MELIALLFACIFVGITMNLNYEKLFYPNQYKIEKENKITTIKNSNIFFDIYSKLKLFNGEIELQIAKDLIKKYNITPGILFSKVEKYSSNDDFSDSMAGGYIDKNIQYSIALLENDILIMETYYKIEDEFDGIEEVDEKLTRIVEIPLKDLI